MPSDFLVLICSNKNHKIIVPIKINYIYNHYIHIYTC